MASPIIHSTSAGFSIALLVCIVVAVTTFVILMVIALRYYLLRRRRHHELRTRRPRSAIYIAPINSKVRPPLQPHEPPRLALHPRTLTPPVLPQVRLHTPFTASRPSIPAQPKQSVVPPPPPLKTSSNSDRQHNHHLAVPISTFSRQYQGRSTRMALYRMDSDIIAPTTEKNDNRHHRPGENEDEDEDDGEREGREVVNKFFAAAVGKREREPDLQLGRWRASARERTILASDSSTISLAGSASFGTGGARNSAVVEDVAEKKSPTGRSDYAWAAKYNREEEGGGGGLGGRLSGGGGGEVGGRGSFKTNKAAHCIKGTWGRHEFIPEPLSVVVRTGERF